MLPLHTTQTVALCRDRGRCIEDPVNLGFYQTLRVSQVPSLQNRLRASLRCAHGDANDYHYIIKEAIANNEVRQGKLIELDIDADTPEAAEKQITEMCEKLLANTVIENYDIQLNLAD